MFPVSAAFMLTKLPKQVLHLVGLLLVESRSQVPQPTMRSLHGIHESLELLLNF